MLLEFWYIFFYNHKPTYSNFYRMSWKCSRLFGDWVYIKPKDFCTFQWCKNTCKNCCALWLNFCEREVMKCHMWVIIQFQWGVAFTDLHFVCQDSLYIVRCTLYNVHWPSVVNLAVCDFYNTFLSSPHRIILFLQWWFRTTINEWRFLKTILVLKVAWKFTCVLGCYRNKINFNQVKHGLFSSWRNFTC